MAETKYQPVSHDHKVFLKKAKKRRGFQAAYQALTVEYAVANEMLAGGAFPGRSYSRGGGLAHGHDKEHCFAS